MRVIRAYAADEMSSGMVQHNVAALRDGSCPVCGELVLSRCEGVHYSSSEVTLVPRILAAYRDGDRALHAQLQLQFRRDILGEREAARSTAGVPAVAELKPELYQGVPALELVDAPETVVRVSGGALSRICAEIYDTVRVDGLETGGLLYASAHGDVLEIEAAGGVGDNAERTERSIEHDVEYWAAFERQLVGTDLHEVGQWHTHPYFAGNDRNWRMPSKEDRRALAAHLRSVEDADVWTWLASVELIFTSPDDAKGDWTDPHVSAYVARRDPVTDRIRVQNAQIEEVD